MLYEYKKRCEGLKSRVAVGWWLFNCFDAFVYNRDVTMHSPVRFIGIYAHIRLTLWHIEKGSTHPDKIVPSSERIKALATSRLACWGA